MMETDFSSDDREVLRLEEENLQKVLCQELSKIFGKNDSEEILVRSTQNIDLINQRRQEQAAQSKKSPNEEEAQKIRIDKDISSGIKENFDPCTSYKVSSSSENGFSEENNKNKMEERNENYCTAGSKTDVWNSTPSINPVDSSKVPERKGHIARLLPTVLDLLKVIGDEKNRSKKLTEIEEIANSYANVDSSNLASKPSRFSAFSSDVSVRSSESEVDVRKKRKDGVDNKIHQCPNDHACKDRQLRSLENRLWKQEIYMVKTRASQELLKEEGKSLVNMIRSVQSDQAKEKELIESLVKKMNEMYQCDFNADQLQPIAEKVDRLEQLLQFKENKINRNENYMDDIRQELRECEKEKEEYLARAITAETKVAQLEARLLEETKKRSDMIGILAKERALYDSMQQSYEKKISNIVKEVQEEQKNCFNLMSSKIENMTKERNELRTKVRRLELEVSTSKAELESQTSRGRELARRKLGAAAERLRAADGKVQELWRALELTVRGIHEAGYANRLAGPDSGDLPSLLPDHTEWLQVCRALAHREVFAPDLAAFLLSLITPASDLRASGEPHQSI